MNECIDSKTQHLYIKKKSTARLPQQTLNDLKRLHLQRMLVSNFSVFRCVCQTRDNPEALVFFFFLTTEIHTEWESAEDLNITWRSEWCEVVWVPIGQQPAHHSLWLISHRFTRETAYRVDLHTRFCTQTHLITFYHHISVGPVLPQMWNWYRHM